MSPDFNPDDASYRVLGDPTIHYVVRPSLALKRIPVTALRISKSMILKSPDPSAMLAKIFERLTHDIILQLGAMALLENLRSSTPFMLSDLKFSVSEGPFGEEIEICVYIHADSPPEEKMRETCTLELAKQIMKNPVFSRTQYAGPFSSSFSAPVAQTVPEKKKPRIIKVKKPEYDSSKNNPAPDEGADIQPG